MADTVARSCVHDDAPQADLKDASSTKEHDCHLKRKRVASCACLTDLSDVGRLCKLKVPGLPAETMVHYFDRLRGETDVSAFRNVENIEHDGIYVHKRPLRGLPEGNPLARCGSVFYHCVIYLKCDGKLHSLDFAPDNGEDVTSNFFSDFPCREIQASDTCIPKEDVMPLLYLGAPRFGLDSPAVQQAIAFAQTKPYNAFRNNCIHFADFIVRLLTDGEITGAPQLYDIVCGTVPHQNDPMIMLMMMATGLSWLDVCDGSRLASGYIEALSQGATPAAKAAEIADDSTMPIPAIAAALAALAERNPKTDAKTVAKTQADPSEKSLDIYQQQQIAAAGAVSVMQVAAATAVEAASLLTSSATVLEREVDSRLAGC